MTRHLSEELRDIIRTLEEMLEANAPEKDDKKDKDTKDTKSDAKDLMVTKRPDDVELNDVETVDDLISYLDQFADLNNWRDPNAAYDDAYYDGVPLDELEATAGITKDAINRIKAKTEPGKGSILVSDGFVSVFGGTNA